MKTETGTKTRIGEDDFLLISGYQEIPEYRTGMSQLAEKVFGLEFETWYSLGYWTHRYCPYSLVRNNRIVANVSVNPMEFAVEGKRYRTLQIGTVMTDPDYRNKGLSRVLLECVLAEHKGKYDLIYLYANSSVREFYPRFGFEKTEEYIYSKTCTRKSGYHFRKLDGRSPENQKLLLRLLQNNVPSAKYTLVDNPYLPMFYLTSFLAECIYYCEKLDLAAVVEYEKESMTVNEIFSTREFSLEEVISCLLDQPERKVTLGFTPLDTASFQCELLDTEDTFFVMGNNFIQKGGLPVLSHA
ncbi:GNAT superfamily N-acetyltransferase [Anaerotaenia torta]